MLCQKGEKLKHHTMDTLEHILREFVTRCKEVPSLFKADIDAAFRRIPVRPEHRKWCAIAFRQDDKVHIITSAPVLYYVLLSATIQIWTARHYACPFGAIGSVHAWERIGAAILHIAHTFLRLPVLRYVDDYFGPDR